MGVSAPRDPFPEVIPRELFPANTSGDQAPIALQESHSAAGPRSHVCEVEPDDKGTKRALSAAPKSAKKPKAGPTSAKKPKGKAKPKPGPTMPTFFSPAATTPDTSAAAKPESSDGCRHLERKRDSSHLEQQPSYKDELANKLAMFVANQEQADAAAQREKEAEETQKLAAEQKREDEKRIRKEQAAAFAKQAATDLKVRVWTLFTWRPSR